MGLDLTDAATKAVKECIEEGILAEYLKSHSSEVVNMLTTEWDIERAKIIWEQEAREEGREEGIREAVLGMKKENIPDDVIARVINLPIEKIKEYTQ